MCPLTWIGFMNFRTVLAMWNGFHKNLFFCTKKNRKNVHFRYKMFIFNQNSSTLVYFSSISSFSNCKKIKKSSFHLRLIFFYFVEKKLFPSVHSTVPRSIFKPEHFRQLTCVHQILLIIWPNFVLLCFTYTFYSHFFVFTFQTTIT